MSENNELILASGSPRRRAFLENMGISFKVVTPDIDESVKEGESPDVYVKRMAVSKAAAVALNNPELPVLAADTIVVCRDEILGKPKDREDAKRILRTLSGRTHQVMTGVCIRSGEKERTILEVTDVTFAELSERLIETYVASGECDDKSGAYAVQGIGAMFIKRVSGSVSSVVGLPVCNVREILEQFGIYPKSVSV